MSGPADTPYRRQNMDPWETDEKERPIKVLPSDIPNPTTEQVWEKLVGSGPPEEEATDNSTNKA